MLELAVPLRERYRGSHTAPACAVLEFHILFSKEDISAGLRLIVAQSRRKSSDALARPLTRVCVGSPHFMYRLSAYVRMRQKSKTKRHSPNKKRGALQRVLGDRQANISVGKNNHI